MCLELITIRIGQRKDYQINFAGQDPNLRDIKKEDLPYCIPTHIIGCDGRQSTELIRLYSPTTQTMKKLKQDPQSLVSNEKECCPILFQDDKGENAIFVKKILIEEGKVTFVFSRKPEKFTVQHIKKETEKLYTFKHVHNASDNYWRLIYENDISNHEKINVTFQIENFERNTHQIQVCISPKSQIRDVVIDFGSEASQISTFERDDIQDINNIEETFSNMRNMLVSEEEKNNEKFEWVQQSESKTLFKSIFYGKQSYNGDIDKLKACTKCNKPEAILRMLTTRQEAQDLLKSGYVVLPTVKLSGYGGIPQPKFNGAHSILEFKDHFFYRKCINNLLLSEFLNIKKVEDGKLLCLNICLLVPNVFRPKQVSKIIRNLRLDINEMIQTEDLLDTIAAIEINTISESDASLMGALEYLDSRESAHIGTGQYLIMDAGKGTLDISIVNYVNQHYVCRYRSGVLGAGNAITFAYMCALLHDFLLGNPDQTISEETIEDFINNKIRKDNDRYLINKMFDAVEDFKKRDKVSNKRLQASNNKDKDLKTFTEFIEKCESLSDKAEQWIQATISEITNNVIKELEISQSEDFGRIDYVYFTGRAFRCKKLKQSITDTLKQEGIISKSTIDLNAKLKPIAPKDYDKLLCLYIRIAVKKGACSDNNFCLPFIRHQWTNQNEVEGILDGLWNMISGIAEKHPSMKQTFSSINASPFVTSRYSIPSSTPEELFSRGMRLGFELVLSNNDKLFYNGYNYSVSQGDKQISGKISLFMVNGEMFIRLANAATRRTEEDTCFKFEEDVINLKSSPLKFGTFFPNVGIDDMVELIIPNSNHKKNVKDTHSSSSDFQQEKQETTVKDDENIVSQFQ